MEGKASFPSTWCIVPYLTATRFAEVYNNVVYFRSVSIDQPEKERYIRQENDITAFSSKSRVRALQCLSMVDPSKVHDPFFVTLTYHDNYPEDARDIKRDLDNFLKRLMRIYPDCYYFWRVELQRRGAPHYHLILWFDTAAEKPRTGTFILGIKKIWVPYIKCGCSACRMNAVKINEVSNMYKASYYISKYMAKTEPLAEQISLGRLWGASRNLPRCSKSFISGTSDSVTLLQFACCLWSLQYTKSNPDYLISLLYRKDSFLFIDHKIVELLADAIAKGETDPCSFVAEKLGVSPVRIINSDLVKAAPSGLRSPSPVQGATAPRAPVESLNSNRAFIADVTLQDYCSTNRNLHLTKNRIAEPEPGSNRY